MRRLEDALGDIKFELRFAHPWPLSRLDAIKPELRSSHERRASGSLSAQEQRLACGIVDFIVRATDPQFEVRRCLECARWFARADHAARSKFCTNRCRNAFHYRRRVTKTYTCARCTNSGGAQELSGLYVRHERCVMGGLRRNDPLVCRRCVAADFPGWRSYAEGSARMR